MTKDTKPYPASTVLSIIAALTLMAAMLLTSCGNAHSKRFLHEMDSLSGVNPKAAIHSIDTFLIRNASIPEGHRMRLMLTRERARNSAFQTFTSDSTAKTLAEYFEKHGTENEKMSAYYLLGCVYQQLELWSIALKYCNMAITQSDTTNNDCDYTTLLYAHSLRANIFQDQLLTKDAIKEWDFVYNNAIKHNLQLLAITSLVGKSGSYYLEHDYDKAIKISMNSYHELKRIHKDNYANANLEILICTLIEMDSVKKAIPYLNLYKQNEITFSSKEIPKKGYEMFYYYQGRVFLEQGLIQKAKESFRKLITSAINQNEKQAAFKGLFLCSQKENVTDSIIKYAKLWNISTDASYQETNTTLLKRIQLTYDNSEKCEKIMKEKNQNKIAFFITFILFLFLIAIVLFAYSFIKRQKTKLQQTKKIIKESRFLLTEKKAELKHQKTIEENIAKEIATKEEEIQTLKEELCNITKIYNYYNNEEYDSCKDIIQRFKDLANKNRKVSPQEIELFMNYTRSTMPKFIHEINKNLNERDLQICCFSSPQQKYHVYWAFHHNH